MTFVIPSHGYELTLADGREVLMDIGVESQRKAVVPIADGVVGWRTGKVITSIKDVYDCETEDHLDPVEWAKECVWPFQPVARPEAKPEGKSRAKYRIHFHYNNPMPPREFSSRAGVMEWIMDGMRSTEGAERDHYVDLLLQLDRGKRELNYN